MFGEVIDKLKVETFNFHSHTVREREKFCGIEFVHEVSEKYLKKHSKSARNIVPLITCGRVEFIYTADDFLDIDGFDRLAGWDAFEHLIEVASGIKTLIVGETQIVGQIKSAFFEARKSGLCGGEMMGLLSEILRISKIVRNTCGIERRSFSSFVKSKALEIFGDTSHLTIFVAGTGKIAHDVFKIAGHFKKLIIYSHSRERAVEKSRMISETLGVEVDYVSSIYEGLEKSDVVVLATRHPGFLVKPEHIKMLTDKFPDKKLLLVDFAVPRNVSPDIKEKEKGIGGERIFLFDIDDVADRNVERNKIEQARGIIQKEIEKLRKKTEAERKVVVLANLRENFRETISSHLKKYTHLEEEDIETIASSLSQKLLHRFFEEFKKEDGENAGDKWIIIDTSDSKTKEKFRYRKEKVGGKN